MIHIAIVTVLVALLTIVTNYFLLSVGLLPVEASTQATIIDKLFNTHFFIISFLFSLISVFMIYSLIVFRNKKGQDEDGKFVTGSTKLEILWTIIPLATVISFSYLGAKSLAETRIINPQAMTINVTASQWAWSFEYPDFEITSSTLYLPVNNQVNLQMTSLDVIHSFWVPEFRVKQDVLPGENLVKELRFTPSIIGNYTLMCAELCGGAHAYMNSPVKVVSEADFQSWVDLESKADDLNPVQKGEKLVKNNGCIGCHTLDGSASVGPTWLGLFGSEKSLMDGKKIIVDDNYLMSSILYPNQDIVQNFSPNIMPSIYADLFSKEELEDIIAFINSLH
ncbi:MAG: cytochrome c oxidase subunit II [Anaerolineaceae bacterium]